MDWAPFFDRKAPALRFVIYEVQCLLFFVFGLIKLGFWVQEKVSYHYWKTKRPKVLGK